MKMSIAIIISIITLVLGVMGAVIKAIWFKVPYGHVVVMMRNEHVKLDKQGKPLVKEPGWRAQVPIRDDKRTIDCTDRTSELKPQELKGSDGKNEVTATADWHVLSLRDGEKFRYHPVRTLIVQDLNQKVEEIVRDAIRATMAISKTDASVWNSDDLYREVRTTVKRKLNRIGVRLDAVRLPSVAPSEAQTHGGILKDSIIDLGNKLSGTPTVDPDTDERPDLRSVHS